MPVLLGSLGFLSRSQAWSLIPHPCLWQLTLLNLYVLVLKTRIRVGRSMAEQALKPAKRWQGLAGPYQGSLQVLRQEDHLTSASHLAVCPLHSSLAPSGHVAPAGEPTALCPLQPRPQSPAQPGDAAHSVECWLSIHRAMGSIPGTPKNRSGGGTHTHTPVISAHRKTSGGRRISVSLRSTWSTK